MATTISELKYNQIHNISHKNRIGKKTLVNNFEDFHTEKQFTIEIDNVVPTLGSVSFDLLNFDDGYLGDYNEYQIEIIAEEVS